MATSTIYGSPLGALKSNEIFGESRVSDHTCAEAKATSARRKIYLSVTIIATVLLQGLPFAFIPFDQVCSALDMSGYRMELSFSTVLVGTLPLYLVLWVDGSVVAIIFAEQKYNRRSRSHFTTICWLVMNSAVAVFDSLQMVWRCTSAPFLYSVWVITAVISFLLYIPLMWLALLRLRVLTSTGSMLRRFGEAAFIVCVIHLVLYVTKFAFENFGFHSGLPNVEIFLVGFVLSHGALNICVIIALNFSARVALAIATVGIDIDGDGGRFEKAARSARRAALITAASEVTTVTYFILVILVPESGDVVWRVLTNTTWLIDISTNTFACLFFSGMIFSEDRVRCEARRCRQVLNHLGSNAGDSTESAVGVATLIDGGSPIEILRIGVAKFRCVSWEVLAKRPDVIIGGGPVDVVGRAGSELYSLSVPCRLGECDAFVSHSWHDDGHLKWEALTSWCEGFKRAHKRYPRIWLDKLCIDQRNIEEDLRCLPIFLAGCNTMFVMSGSTYHRRLWCSVEMLVYKQMLETDSIRMPPVLWLIGFSNGECQSCLQGWRQFDVRECECSQVEDKRMFLRLVERYPGGAEEFNHFMRNLAEDMQISFCSDYEIEERV